MNRRAAVIAAGALVALALPLASPAGAAPPARGCPGPFMSYDRDAQFELAQMLLGLSDDEADALVAETLVAFDRNGDDTLCFAFQNKVRGEPNIIDNTAVDNRARAH